MTQYKRHIKQFMRYADIDTGSLESDINTLYEHISQDKEWFRDTLMTYLAEQKGRVTRKEISTSTLRNLHKPIKLFCDMNDILLNWVLIAKGMPTGKRSSNDRAPRLDEIHVLLEYKDMRMKPIVLVMVSSGIRLGAWEYLKWKHVKPIYEGDTVVAARLTVYADESDQYISFITPEAYKSLEAWMEFRSSYGEKITPESWLMRDMWRTTSVPYGTKFGLAKFPQKLSHKTIRVMINRALYKLNLRPPTLPKNVKTHEFKAVHGFRKYFKTVCEYSGMKPANIELLIGHDIGISSSYYKPTESQLLEDYLKAVNALTVEKSYVLQEQLISLQKQKDESERRLEERMNQLEEMFQKAEGDKEKFRNI
jgi:flagellar capping protein FliD